MATAQSLIEAVQRKVQDASYTPEMILSFLNQGIREIASWKNTNPNRGLHGEILLPMLETSDTVDTEEDVAMIDLPEDFLKNLYHVEQESHVPIDIVSGMRELLYWSKGKLDNSGQHVNIVTVQGSTLFYQPIPDTPVELRLHYYKKPPPLTLEDPESETNVPWCLPEHLHEDLLVNYAAKEIYGEIEDGVDGRKVQTEFYSSRYQVAMFDLYKNVAHKSYQRPTRRRGARFF